ncbi:hypothetical protein [Paenibacillus aceti]|uniref:Uncharacterized protein n=1 Tax=Paenibacillus aceti TaxID=1820010 RepID=A0ABQ1W816_9BACL|nr:hypothetical protein GCM10010913_43310 [Paenibacillus aceti]
MSEHHLEHHHHDHHHHIDPNGNKKGLIIALTITLGGGLWTLHGTSNRSEWLHDADRMYRSVS